MTSFDRRALNDMRAIFNETAEMALEWAVEWEAKAREPGISEEARQRRLAQARSDLAFAVRMEGH